jgi:hypothetical protein
VEIDAVDGVQKGDLVSKWLHSHLTLAGKVVTTRGRSEDSTAPCVNGR